MHGREVPMTTDMIFLGLRPSSRGTLRLLLTAAASMPEGARVVDHLPSNPWGDLDDFQTSVYEPLRTGTSVDPSTPGRLAVADTDVASLFGVLQGLSESFAGGVPWSALSGDERAVVSRCLRSLDD